MAPEPPATVPSDTIIPLHYLDDQFVTRAIVLHFTYRFDDVLDPEKLRLALERLMELPGWNKMGGRIRRNTNGKLDYHVPARYDTKRPGFRWSLVNTGLSVDEHYLGRRLPKAGKHPAIFENSAKFAPLLVHEHTPTKIEDWLYTDAPSLSVRAITFTDATLLSVSWSHVFFDAVGQTALLEAWIAVLEGREEDLPPYLGYDSDPFDAFEGRTPPEKFLFYHALLTGVGFLLFVFHTILEFVFHPKQSTRAVFIPSSLLQALRSRAVQELTVSDTTSPDAKPFVSEGDVMLAWWGKVTVAALHLSPSRPINLMNIMNFRGMLDDVLPPDQAFVGNAMAVIYTPTTARELLAEPLGTTAMRIRRSLEQQKTREQVEAFVSVHTSSMEKTGRGPLVGPANQMMVTLSNWHRARFFDYDWSAAVVRAGKPLESRKNKLGRPSYIHMNGHENGFSIRNAGALIGKDAEGNVWMTWALREEAWPLVEAEMRRWQKLVM